MRTQIYSKTKIYKDIINIIILIMLYTTNNVNNDQQSAASTPMTPSGTAGKGEVSWHGTPGWDCFFKIHAQTWKANNPIGVVLFLHGWLEMIDSVVTRRFAHALNAKNITLVAYDHDMHGKSMGVYDGCCGDWCQCIGGFCRGNVYPLTVGAAHAVEMSRIVGEAHKGLPFVIVGHSMGGGTAMLAVEAIADGFKASRNMEFKGAVYLAPGNNGEFGDNDCCRWCCCPLCCVLSKLPCFICNPDAKKTFGPPPAEKPNLAADNVWCNVCVPLMLLPERFGGLPGQPFWKEHHGSIPYTIMVGDKDTTVKPQPCEMMRNAAPEHGQFEKLPGAGHELFADKEDWTKWTVKVAGAVEKYLQE